MTGSITINRERCKSCGYCIEACPMGVIAIGDAFNKSGIFPAVVLRPEKCTGCAMCAKICPEIAIEVFITETGDRS